MSAAAPRVVLVGCGAMGEIVAREVYATADAPAVVTSVVDARRERREEVGALLRVPGYASLTEALADGPPADAVDVRVPHEAHAEVAGEAIARRLHVLVEKPVAMSLPEADALIVGARHHRVVAAVAENYPHLSGVRDVAVALRDGSIGDVVALTTARAFTLDGVWVRDGWRTTGAGSGILLDQGTHHTSMLRRLGGEITAVSAAVSGGGDTVLVTSRFATGLAAQSLYTWSAQAVADEAEATVYGSAGRLEVRVDYEGRGGGAFRIGPGRDDAAPIGAPENYYDSHLTMIEDWVRAIREGSRPLVGLDDARADLAVVLAAVRSLDEDGRMVAVDHAVIGAPA